MNVNFKLIKEKQMDIELHQAQSIQDRNELALKITRLSRFIDKNSVFKTLPLDEQARLRYQFLLMCKYYDILNERIDNF